MEKTTLSKYLYKESETSNMNLPEKYVIKKEKTREEKIKELEEKIRQLEKVALEGHEPSPAEVVETAKMCAVHPYYEARAMINQLRELINQLSYDN